MWREVKYGAFIWAADVPCIHAREGMQRSADAARQRMEAIGATPWNKSVLGSIFA